MRDDAVSEVRARTDVAELVGHYVPLKRTGRTFKGLCPFHQEKTPSFIVFPESGTFHCFGCGKGGDVLTFYQEIEHVPFREALTELSKRVGVEIRTGPPPSPERDAHRRRLIELNDLAATWFAQQLRSARGGTEARELVKRRDISDEMVEAFQLGYAPDSWDALTKVLMGRGIDIALAIEIGLIGERDSGGHYDRFRDRFIFPIRDREGEVVGFAGRSVGEEQPKYLNSPQSSIFDKSHLLYALDRAKEEIRKQDQAVVVEGYMDVVAAHQFGYTNVVASMGTALTESQFGLLKRHTKRVVLAMDADAAGQMAMVRALDSLPETGGEDMPVPVPGKRLIQFEKKLNLDIRVLEIPSGKDPDELIRADSAAWPEIVKSARPFMAFYIDRITDGIDLTEPRAKTEAVEKVAPLLRLLPDRITQDHYVDQLAVRLRIADRRSLIADIRRGSAVAGPSGTGMRPALDRKEQDVEDHLLALLLKYEVVTEDVRTDVLPEDFLDARNRAIFRALERQYSGGGSPESDEALDPTLEEHVQVLLNSLGERASALPIKVKSEARQTLDKLRKNRYDRLVHELQMDITLAQREGDLELVDSLLMRYGQLTSEHRQYAPRKSSYFRDTRDPRPAASKFKPTN